MLACGDSNTSNTLPIEHHLSHAALLRTCVYNNHLRLCLELNVAIFHPTAFAHNGLPSCEGVILIEVSNTGVAIGNTRITVYLYAFKGIRDANATKCRLHLLYGTVGIKEQLLYLY